MTNKCIEAFGPKKFIRLKYSSELGSYPSFIGLVNSIVRGQAAREN